MDNIQAKSIQLSIDKIHLDFSNPRITGQKFSDEFWLLEYMYYHYSLEELALSMSQFWYFNAEPIVVIPKNLPDTFANMSVEELNESSEYEKFINDSNTEFIVVEWNRRISTIKILLDIDGVKGKLSVRKDIFKQALKPEIENDLKVIPATVYPNRSWVIPYLWVRHIWWNKAWEPYPQALYIASLIEEEWYSFDEVKNLMSDKNSKVIKNYVSLKLLDYAQELSLDVGTAKNLFSLLTLSIWQQSIKEYLWLPTSWGELEWKEEIIWEQYKENFIRFFKWIFWDKTSGTQSIIWESRDITNYLAKTLANNDSKIHLEKTNDLMSSYEKSDWEKNMVISWLNTAHRKLLNLRDSLEYLLSKDLLNIEEIEKEVLSLNNDIKDINIIYDKYKIDV